MDEPRTAAYPWKSVALSLLSRMKGIATDRTVVTIHDARKVAAKGVQDAEAAIEREAAEAARAEVAEPTGGHTWAEHVDCAVADCAVAYLARVEVAEPGEFAHPMERGGCTHRDVHGNEAHVYTCPRAARAEVAEPGDGLVALLVDAIDEYVDAATAMHGLDDLPDESRLHAAMTAAERATTARDEVAEPGDGLVALLVDAIDEYVDAATAMHGLDDLPDESRLRAAMTAAEPGDGPIRRALAVVLDREPTDDEVARAAPVPNVTYR